MKSLKHMTTSRSAAGGHHTLVMVSTSTQPLPSVYSFGGGSFGKLGQGTTTSHAVPLEIVALSPAQLTATEVRRRRDRVGGANPNIFLDWIVSILCSLVVIIVRAIFFYT